VLELQWMGHIAANILLLKLCEIPMFSALRSVRLLHIIIYLLVYIICLLFKENIIRTDYINIACQDH